MPCIVPVTYAYDGHAIYGYSLLGAKIEHMSANPRVCVEVDRVEDAANWRSVIVRGIFEQLSGKAAVEAVERISERLRTVADATSAPSAWRCSSLAQVGMASRIAFALPKDTAAIRHPSDLVPALRFRRQNKRRNVQRRPAIKFEPQLVRFRLVYRHAEEHVR